MAEKWLEWGHKLDDDEAKIWLEHAGDVVYTTASGKVGFAASHRLRVQHQTRDHRRNLHQQRVKTPPTAGWVRREDALGNLEEENKKPKIASSFLNLAQRNATHVSSTRHDKQGSTATKGISEIAYRDYSEGRKCRDAPTITQEMR
ncbi:hypothetical protein FSST1_006374 [Fusarium sambucinum]